jgi:hypothetical protein
MYVSVGPGGAPAAKFTIDSLSGERSPDGQPMVVATVRNTGGRALDMSGILQLSGGPGGLRAGPFPANLGITLGIGDTERVTVVLDKQLPAGPWNAVLTLRSGLVQDTAHATITFPAVVTSSRSSPPYLAIAALVVILALLGIAAGLLITRRRLRFARMPIRLRHEPIRLRSER